MKCNPQKSYLQIYKKFYGIIILLALFVGYYVYLDIKAVDIPIFFTSDAKGNMFDLEGDQISGLISLPYLLPPEKNYLLFDLGNNFYKRFKNESNILEFARFVEKLNYDALNIGFGELSLGIEELENLKKNSNLPFVSANLKAVGKTNLFLPYIVREIKGIRVGVIGFTDKDSLDLQPISKAQFFEFNLIFQTLRKYIRILKKEEKVDIIILLSRYDFFQGRNFIKNNLYHLDNMVIAKELPEIDLIIFPTEKFDIITKNHVTLTDSRKHKTIICSSLNDGKFLNKITLVVRKKSKNIISFSTEIFEKKIDEEIVKDDEIFKKLNDEKQKYRKVIGRTNFKLKKKFEADSNLGDFITDAIRIHSNAEISIIKNEDIMSEFNKGEIFYSDLVEIFPHDYRILNFKIKGKALKKFLELGLYRGLGDYINTSGMTYSFVKSLPVYAKIVNVKMDKNNEIFDENKIYSVSTIERTLFSKLERNLPLEAFDINDTGLKIRNVLENYLTAYIPIHEKYDETNPKTYKQKSFVFKRNK